MKVTALPNLSKRCRVSRLSVTDAVDHARRARSGYSCDCAFPRIDADDKDEDGSKATDGGNLVCRCVTAVREAVPDIGLITDVALDPFTTHGHDGIIRDGQIANDETVEILSARPLFRRVPGQRSLPLRI